MTMAITAVGTCGGLKEDGTLCELQAGWGTDHFGRGRCKLHGGSSLKGAEHPNFKHGKRSKYQAVVRAQLRDKMALIEDDDPFSIADEALLLRAVLMDVLERDKATDADIQRVVAIADQITRTVERMTRMRNDTAITVSEVALVAARMADIASRYITDGDQLQRFLGEVFDTVGLDRPEP